ncbi:cytochrome P450 94A1-like [Neltuma alba]|uniref:cytochrome P450 94A1-like n=1 Tax=Neltuma alba TaxID=207710 RepID=UPI0010A41832|nr:cytochrome P450 94A1-like [Prosopis alba]XP_028767404.1 cytochrome P450 94A1-like [Prosopis alba]
MIMVYILFFHDKKSINSITCRPPNANHRYMSSYNSHLITSSLGLLFSLPCRAMDLLTPPSLLFVFLIVFYLYLSFLRSFRKSPEKGFRNYPLLGTLPDFLKNRERFLDWTTQVLRDCPTKTAVFFRPGKVQGIITANPDNVEHMLKTNFPNYPKGERFISLLHDFLGTGIFNSDGDLWKVQRKTASYEFNTKSLRNFVIENVTVEIQTRLVPLLSGASDGHRVLDLQDILERFAFDNICKLAFNYDPECLGGEGTGGTKFMSAFEDAATLSSRRFMYALPVVFIIKKWLNVGSERRLREAIMSVHEFADEIIRSTLEAKESNRDLDLLSRFIGTEESSPEFLRDIVISFILAGRDTTSAALSWFFWILSSRPDVKQEIRDELGAIRSRNGTKRGEAFGYEELKDMNYLQAAISETMRLYPPVPVDTKACLNDDVLPDGTVIRKDWFISYHTYAMGRMESIWGKDCCEFKPERWIENGVYRGENPFRYPVFHAGPRLCLGKDLAYIQMKCIAASVMDLFEIEAQNKDKCPDHVLSLTLRMKGGLPVEVAKRDILTV